MNTTLLDAVHNDEGATAPSAEVLTRPGAAAPWDWPEQAIDACAPEGAYLSAGDTPGARGWGLGP